MNQTAMFPLLCECAPQICKRVHVEAALPICLRFRRPVPKVLAFPQAIRNLTSRRFAVPMTQSFLNVRPARAKPWHVGVMFGDKLDIHKARQQPCH